MAVFRAVFTEVFVLINQALLAKRSGAERDHIIAFASFEAAIAQRFGSLAAIGTNGRFVVAIA